mmetsp:Transcript_12927/g.17974  ORF Transcript_12927/g.17974 Transcript_12927/m.17974 type:complete len:124 (-) Transcript_12927:292-663(-)
MMLKTLVGPRTWTALTYLTSQDETKGGFTAFPALNNLKIKPDKGDCIIWPNAYDGTLIKDYRTFHAGTKVKYGKKYTFNQNFRMGFAREEQVTEWPYVYGDLDSAPVRIFAEWWRSQREQSFF